ncbi:tRNA nucleotidyltransferase [invertebrate metagenome]|uniref:tRNA nucleotidyltransferase n=1 Tax=invertebrate metagenome TaxID=1711999 RepID=A0A484H7Y4_9ZZZZ
MRFVGGCVRDILLRRPFRDIDLATPNQPERVLWLLQKAGIRTAPIGITHGTVSATTDNLTCEITSLRCDIACNGRHAVIVYTDDWTEDAARRDFTINALSADPAGAIYDPFSGLSDLYCGHVRFVGSPLARIEEDILRLLRYFRFHGWYGRSFPNGEALSACRELAPRLALLSGERVREELWKILLAPDPAGILLLMRDINVLQHILKEACNFNHLRVLAWLEEHGLHGITPDPLRRLAAVLTSGVATAESVATRLRLSKHERRRLCSLLEEVPLGLTPAPGMTESTLRRALQTLGAARFRDLTLLQWAGAATGSTAVAEHMAWLQILKTALAWRNIPFPVRGRDALALGLAPGQKVGALLSVLYQWWEETGYQASRQILLARLVELVRETERGSGKEGT